MIREAFHIVAETWIDISVETVNNSCARSYVKVCFVSNDKYVRKEIIFKFDLRVLRGKMSMIKDSTNVGSNALVQFQ